VSWLVTLLVVVGGVALSSPGQAKGLVLSDSDQGYRMTVRVATKGFTLRFDHAYGGGGTLFQLSCGRKRHGSRQFAAGFAPITTEKSFTGGLNNWNSTKRFCDLTKTADGSTTTAATFHLKPRR
jgi:hypothetical protein